MTGSQQKTAASPFPDEQGKFGKFGGRFIPEVLIPAVRELESAYADVSTSSAFQNEFRHLLREYAGRPHPLTLASRLSEAGGGARIYLKREDLNHTGAHKINNVLGQLLLAKHLGKPRIIAETGAGQHGVATATVAAKLGLQCIVYMGHEDMQRQALNVFRMELLGAEVVPVHSGSRTLKDAINEAIRDWVTNVSNTFYCIGSVVGPHPYPRIVRDFQSVIGEETIAQHIEREKRDPDVVVACVGGGSNAMGMFYPFIGRETVRLVGVEAGGRSGAAGEHAATLTYGEPGILHGMMTYLLQNEDGQVSDVHSVSAGLDYPAVGPEHAWLKETGRVEYTSVTDAAALRAMETLSRYEGIIPALESAHAVAWAVEHAPKMRTDETLVICLSGRGDKDMATVHDILKNGKSG